MASLSEKIIKIIDERIKKKVENNNYVTKYTGIVTAVSDDNVTITVKIIGYDTEFNFLNKTGDIIQVNDGVNIECINKNLTNGYISEKFGVSEILNNNQKRQIFTSSSLPDNTIGNNGDIWLQYGIIDSTSAKTFIKIQNQWRV